MRSLIQAIVNGILQFVVGYVEKERRIIAEARVKVEKGRLRSVVETVRVEKRLRISRPLRPSRTVSDWNKKAKSANGAHLGALLVLCKMPTAVDWWFGARLGALLVLCFLMISCAPVIVESRWPIIPVPARPILPEEPSVFSPREIILVDYAEELELRMEVYNEEAHEHNLENGY
ncbi:MAG TPA: hypothetical protein ENI27_03695 [bacterium]|nr:hypothetical protein [bacterium]